MNNEEIPYALLKVGKRYIIRFSDCCLNGELFSVEYQGMDCSEEMHEEFKLDIGRFENTGSQKISFFEI